MLKWSWQKWVGKIAPLAVGALTQQVWSFTEMPVPTWAPIVAGLLTFVAQQALALFPPKEA